MKQTAIQKELPIKPTETSIQTGEPPGFTGETQTQRAAPKHPVVVFLGYIADLRITVVLFALSMALVFWGTLAQTDNGVWTVVRDYFRSFIVMVPLKVVLFN